MGLLRGMTMVDLLSRKVCVLADLGVSELSEEADGPLLQVAGQAGPDMREGDGRLGRRRMTTHGGPSRKRCCQDRSGAS